MLIWTNGKYEQIEIGQRVFIGYSYRSNTYGEFGRLDRVTKAHAVFVSDSGSVIKTALDNINRVAGGFRDRFFVSLNTEGREFFQVRPHYWDSKKCEMRYK